MCTVLLPPGVNKIAVKYIDYIYIIIIIIIYIYIIIIIIIILTYTSKNRILNLSLLMSMELLLKPEILTSYIYMDLRLATLKAVSFYLLLNV
jgi:hypothetical protein